MTIYAHLTALGCALATTISYHANASIMWAVVHGVLGWWFVAYAAIFYD